MTGLVLFFNKLFSILSELSENYSLPTFLSLYSYSILGAGHGNRKQLLSQGSLHVTLMP